MGEQWGRKYILTIGTTQMTDFELDATIKRTLKPEPNSIELTIYNLGPTNRAACEAAEQPIQLDAGYELDTLTNVYLGTTTNGRSGRPKVEWETKITAGDGAKKLRAARAAQTIGKGAASPVSVFSGAAQALQAAGIGGGNIASAAASFDAALNAKLGKLGKLGVPLFGNGARQMNAVSRSVGVEYSVQSEKLQVLALGKAIAGTAVVLNSATGLVGTPTIETKGKEAGRVRFETNMIPGILPGGLVLLTSSSITGQFRIEATTCKAEFPRGAWGFEAEAVPY